MALSTVSPRGSGSGFGPVRGRWLAALAGVGLGVFSGGPQILRAEDPEQLFVRRIQPLLREKCLGCHGDDPAKIKSDYDIRTRETAFRGGESGERAIVPGQPEKSPLFLSVTRQHLKEWEAMPPKEADRLSAEQVGWIREWIAGGAPWPDAARTAEITKAHGSLWAAEDGSAVKTSGGLSSDWSNRKYKPEALWGYQPVRKPVLNGVDGSGAIDALLNLRLPKGLVLAGETDARTFIRRVTFDLTGLPPEPNEVEAFASAYEAADVSARDQVRMALINRLLESPHYGERMAQHWLDVARYADSSGFSNDYERGNAWRYRDYVVRAFNTDKPYPQFVREQIAGDELDPKDPEKIVATGFLRMGPWELTGMEVERVARQRFLDDVTNSVGETFLAHSLQCARCHDHKFDPVPTRDYYAIQAVFATTQLAERAAPFLPGENVEGFDERQFLEKTRDEHLATLARLDALLLENARQWFRDQGRDPARWNAAVAALQAQPEGSRMNEKRRPGRFSLFDDARKRLADEHVPESEYPPKLVGFTPEQFGLERVARKGLERLRWELDRYEPYALGVYSGRTRQYKTVFTPLRMPDNRMTEGELETACIRLGGDPFSEGPHVNPGVLSVLGAAQKKPVPETIEGRRAAFAEWVASPDNPLTTRAIVNRIWMWHFGEPIAGNPNNFGGTGKKPTHPELLDWLAATFVEQGWSFKNLHRIILQSAAYRRSANHPAPETLAETDPQGTSCAVFKPRRLSAEELRDAMLAVSGELNRTLGGIPNRPELHPEAALQPRQVMGTFASAWVPNPRPEQRNRRSLYALKLRGLTDPAMEVFNAPAPDFSCERRDASTVTPQVFALFNSRTSRVRALALAARVLAEAADDSDAIRRCFARVYGRPARPDELELCLRHWREMEMLQPVKAPPAPPPPVTVRRDAVEENTGEKFSFTERLHANEAYVPDLQPADCDPRTRALAEVCLSLLNTNEFAYVY